MGHFRKSPYPPPPPVEDIGYPGEVGIKNIRGYQGGRWLKKGISSTGGGYGFMKPQLYIFELDFVSQTSLCLLLWHCSMLSCCNAISLTLQGCSCSVDLQQNYTVKKACHEILSRADQNLKIRIRTNWPYKVMSRTTSHTITVE